MKKDLIIILGFIVLSFALLWHSAYRTDVAKPKANEQGSELVIGVNAEYPPFAFIEDGQLVGLDIDLLKHLAKILNKKPVFKQMSWTALLPEVQLGAIQMIASGVTRSEERAKRILFSKPYLEGDKLVIVTKKEAEAINALDDLINKTVVVNEGFLADAFVSEIDGIDVRRLETINHAFMELNSGLVDAFISDQVPLQGYFEKFGSDAFKIIPIEGTDVAFSFGISKKYPELKEEIDQALDILKQSDEYEVILDTWIKKNTHD